MVWTRRPRIGSHLCPHRGVFTHVDAGAETHAAAEPAADTVSRRRGYIYLRVTPAAGGKHVDANIYWRLGGDDVASGTSRERGRAAFGVLLAVERAHPHSERPRHRRT